MMETLGKIIDQVHAALRGIDAADQSSAIPAKQLDAVSKRGCQPLNLLRLSSAELITAHW